MTINEKALSLTRLRYVTSQLRGHSRNVSKIQEIFLKNSLLLRMSPIF